jgi:cytochrome c oxidase accessory protein FixG
MGNDAKNKDGQSRTRNILPGTQFHRIRRTVQSICFVIFVLLPLFDVMRVDLPRQRFYFFGAELYINEFAIIFLTMMFVWILVAAGAMIYGRFWCGYLCPQMIFSEAAGGLEKRINRMVNRKFSNLGPGARRALSVVLFSAVLLPGSIFVTFVFVSYFVPPLDLFHRLLTIDMRTAAGITGASVTLITVLDFAFLRTRFCTAICPYGYLQNMLADKHTLLVHFQEDSSGKCILCQKCVRACPMGIDIRRSSHQLECTHCAECIDACSEVLGKMGRGSMIHYAWGDVEQNFSGKNAWYRRIGLRDGKRVAILVLLLIYATGLSIAINLRQAVMVRVMPDRITLYTRGDDGLIHNRFRILASNRGKTDTKVTFSLAGLPAGRILGMDDGVALKPGETLQREFDIAADATQISPGINHMTIVAHVVPTQKDDVFAENFIAPMEGAPATAPAGKQQ